MYEYEKDGAEIYRRSFATIRAEADLAGLPADVAPGRRADDPRLRAGRPGRATSAARPDVVAGRPRAPCDAGAPDPVRRADGRRPGSPARRLPADNEVICTLHDPRVPELAARAAAPPARAAALELWRDRLDGAVVAIGNAPTALFHLLEMIAAGGPRPAAVIGIPVGFIGAAESKEALAAAPTWSYLVVRGRRGGSAITAAAVNAIASEASEAE